MNGLRFFNPYADIRHTENRLPHWQQEGAVYFVTFRLADAVPSTLLAQWESKRDAWLRIHPEPWTAEIEREYHERFSGAIERCSTRDMAPVSYAGANLPKSWRKRCVILKANGWLRFRRS